MSEITNYIITITFTTLTISNKTSFDENLLCFINIFRVKPARQREIRYCANMYNLRYGNESLHDASCSMIIQHFRVQITFFALSW